MKLIHRPKLLFILTAGVWLVIPVIMINMAIVKRVPLFKLGQWQHLRFIIPFLIWCAVTSAWIYSARWKGFFSFLLMSGILLYGNAYLLFSTKNYGLAFFALGVLILSFFFSTHLFQVLSMVFLDSGRNWYERYPKFLPNIQAHVILEKGEEVEGRISNLGVEGCFFYTQQKIRNPKQILLNLRDKINVNPVQCKVELISQTRDDVGYGFMFRFESLDQWKTLQEFIDRSRSYGYV